MKENIRFTPCCGGEAGGARSGVTASGRRGFLKGLATVAAAAAAPGCIFLGKPSEYDATLTVFLSDIHVCGDPSLTRWHYTRAELDTRVVEILAMRPLPRRVVCFGDLAFNAGDPRDYRLAAATFKLLRDAGIEVTHAMGNHDRRAPFLEAFPEYAGKSPVEGRLVSVVKTPAFDLILLDSMKGDGGPVEGALDDAQQQWLEAELPKWPCPVFVGAHHGHNELRVAGAPLLTLLKRSPKVVGYINGHVHRWARQWSVNWSGGNERTIRWMSLPSAGFWGEIGSVRFRAFPGRAEAELVQHAFWFNDPTSFGKKKPSVWDVITRENQGERCTFPLNG